MDTRLQDHPCFCETASRYYARIHLPVAPECNIQCKYCNRKYNCSNESRPGVTSCVLSPEEAANRVKMAVETIPEISVIGIAGPGDPMANPDETLKTFALVRRDHPDINLCLSTNGLVLSEHIEALKIRNVDFITITINAIEAAVGKEINSWIHLNGKTLYGEEAAAVLWKRQREALIRSKQANMLIKVNTVLIPGINDDHIPDIAKEIQELGVYILNIMPLIPVPNTEFSSIVPPSLELRHSVVKACSKYMKIMRHCRQCRADAVGMLGADRSQEFICGIQG